MALAQQVQRAALAPCVLLGITAGFCNPAIAAELTQPAGLVREAVVIPAAGGRAGGVLLKLDAVVTRPAAPGRYPLVLINHGASRSPEGRANEANGLTPVAIEFARRGWAAAVVARRGYGRSQGQYAEGFGSCADPDYQAAGLASAEDIFQTAWTLQRQPYVDPNRLLLAGVSAGGFASLATASNQPPGLVGVINFAGGRGSPSDGTVCREERLVAAVAHFGKTVRVPTLWVYAENDRFFSPQLARAMFDAFIAAGAGGELIIVPPFGNNGHFLFSAAGIPQWRNLVDDFLRKHNLPTWMQPVTVPAPKLPLPLDASPDLVKEFERYLASENYEKAFVIGATGRFRWVAGRRTPEDAVADALKGCQQAGAVCKPYAINDMLADNVRQSGSVKAAFENNDLIGTFAWDCGQPASKNNLYYVNRVLDADHVQRDEMIGPTTRDAVTIIDQAIDRGPREIAITGTREGQPIEAVWRLEADRQIGFEVNIGGRKVISGGRLLSTGREVPWLNKCETR